MQPVAIGVALLAAVVDVDTDDGTAVVVGVSDGVEDVVDAEFEEIDEGEDKKSD